MLNLSHLNAGNSISLNLLMARRLHMIGKKLSDAMNDQIKNELESAYL